MEVVAYASVAYLTVQVLVALVNLVSRQYLKKGETPEPALISILIPARNEQHAIGLLLDDLRQLRSENLEILVYDDESTDGTKAVIMDKSATDGRVHYIGGKGILPGWLGKNHACHQLSLAARGDYFLFLDADVRISQDLLPDALACIRKHDLDLLSLFPVQYMKTWGEWLTVPLMNRILTGNLPLILVRKSRLPAFAAANGQFMMFKAETYKKNRFHSQVKHEKVEDIRISRNMKSAGYRIHTLLSNGQVTCRMYPGFLPALNGFSKNVNAFFGGSWLILFLYVALTTMGPVAVLISMPAPVAIGFFTGLVFFIIMTSVQSRQSWWLNTVLVPFQQVALVIISILAVYRQTAGMLYWKGRRI